MTSSRMAMSVTERAIGPAVSRTPSSGTTPVRDTNPTVGLKPDSALCADGMRTEPPVSVPMPTTAKLDANAAAGPPEEPPVA